MQQTGTIGIVGGGQLGRMLTEAAKPLGFKVIVIDPSDNCPAAQVGAEQIKADFYDENAIRELSDKADYITIESEHVNTLALAQLAADRKPVNPSPKTVGIIQDKFIQKQFLREAGIPIADFVEITDMKSAKHALDRFSGKMLVKTRHGAFDGRGNALITSLEELEAALKAFGGKQLYAERYVPFAKELAVMIAIGSEGEIAVYPVTETIHQRNICIETLTPADIDTKVVKQAEKFAQDVAQHLDGSGVFGIEMFLTEDNQILVNEIAPRVHNSGHYTIEACETSQFEQHIRAITGMPLGKVDMKVPAAVMINILGERDGPTEAKGIDKAEAYPHTYVHLYGKSPTKVDRKMGHITVTADTTNEATQIAEKARSEITI